jgi:hypothetical protein
MSGQGYKSSEFAVVAVAVVFAGLVATGWLTPSKVQLAADRVHQTTEAVPTLIAAVKELAASLGPLAGMLGLAWAYLRKRSKNKRDAIDCEVAKIEAQRDVGVARAQNPPGGAAQ